MTFLDRTSIVIVLLLAASLRFAGITFGQPNPEYNRSLYPMLHLQTVLHPDEYFYVAIPYEMAVRGTLNPHFYENPSFLIYLNFFTFKLTNALHDAQPERWADMNNRSYAPFPLYVVGRVYSALGGIITVAAVYAAVRLIANHPVALCAGLLAAVSFPLVQHAHYTTTSSLAAGGVALCLWACIVSLKLAFSGKVTPLRRFFQRWWIYLLLAGIAAGLAAGNRYNAAVVSIVVFLTGMVVWLQARTWQRAGWILIGYVAFPMMLLLTTPGILFDFDTFVQQFTFIYQRFAPPATFTGRGLFYEYRYIVFFGLGLPGMLLACSGVFWVVWAWLWRKPVAIWQTASILMLSFILPYSLGVLNTSVPEIGDQLTLPVLPAWLILVGIGVAALPSVWQKSWRYGLLIVIVVLPLLPLTLPMSHYFTQTDTRYQMQRWIYEHLSKGSRILLAGAYNVPLDFADYDVTQYFDYPPVTVIESVAPDYLLVSDAIDFFQSRLGDWTQNRAVEAYSVYPQTVSFSRLKLWGNEWLPNNFVYWHHPALTLYCIHETVCDADVSH